MPFLFPSTKPAPPRAGWLSDPLSKRRLQVWVVCAFWLMGLCVVACEDPPPKTPSAWAWIGTEPLTFESLERELETLSDTSSELVPGAEDRELLKREMMRRIAERSLLVKEAQRRGISLADHEYDAALAELTAGLPKEQVQKRMAEPDWINGRATRRLRENLLVEKLFRDEIYPRILVSEKEIEEEYAKDPERFTRPERLRVRQIVTTDEQKAEEAYQAIRLGKMTFPEAAKQYSIAPEKERGGDLGWVERGQFPEELEQLLFEQRVGRLSRVTKSPFGYHVFMVSAKKPKETMSLEQVRGTIKTMLYERKKHQAERKLLEQAKTSFQFRWNESFKPPISLNEPGDDLSPEGMR